MAHYIPALVPVDLRLVLLRAPFGIREPYKGKRYLFHLLQIANDFDAFQGSEFAFETTRWVEDRNLFKVFKIQLMRIRVAMRSLGA